MRPRISIRGSVRPAVRRSVGWLVGNAFFSNSENEELSRKDASISSANLFFYGFSLQKHTLSKFCLDAMRGLGPGLPRDWGQFHGLWIHRTRIYGDNSKYSVYEENV